MMINSQITAKVNEIRLFVTLHIEAAELGDHCHVGETREVWAGFVKRQFSSSGQWLDSVFHSVYVKLPFACNVCLILGIWDQLFCLEITFNKSYAFSIHQNTPGGMGHCPGGMGRCHVSYSFLDNDNNARSWYLP